MQYELTIPVGPNDDARHCGNLATSGNGTASNVLVAAIDGNARDMVTLTMSALICCDRHLPTDRPTISCPKLPRLAPERKITNRDHRYADMDSSYRAIPKGAGDYILKPINPEALRKERQNESSQRPMIEPNSTASNSSPTSSLEHRRSGRIWYWNLSNGKDHEFQSLF